MPIPTLSPGGLNDHLAALGLRRGHHVVVHSRLLSLGVVEGGTAAVLRALGEAVGDTGSVVVPAYCWQRGPDFVFDPAATPPEQVGALSTYAWGEAGWSRSPCPIHSHLGFGAKAALLTAVSGLDSTGPDSDFALFRREGFHLLTLGLSLGRGASYLHHVEDMAAVPYRQELFLPRRRRAADGTVSSVQVRYYGFPPQVGGAGQGRWRENFDVVEHRMAEDGTITRVACPFVDHSSYCMVADAHATATALLAQSPHALVLPPETE